MKHFAQDDPEKQQMASSAATGHGAPTAATDLIKLLLKLELEQSDAVAACLEASHSGLTEAWRYSVPPAGSRAPVRLILSDAQSAIPMLSGMASSGRRCALFNSHPRLRWPQDPPPAFAPFLLYDFRSGHTIRPPLPAAFILIAKTAQQAYDLSLIGRRLAEESLLPGILHVEIQGNRGRIQELDTETRRAFTGLASDRIETSTKRQRQVFGESRRRVPVNAALEDQALHRAMLAEVPNLFQRCAEAYAEITGRVYKALGREGATDAPVVFLALGPVAETLRRAVPHKQATILHLTLLHPFPGAAVASALAGKPVCCVLTPAEQAEDDILRPAVLDCLEKALANGRTAADKQSALPYPGFPKIVSVTDLPRLSTAYLAGQPVDPIRVNSWLGQVRQDETSGVTVDLQRRIAPNRRVTDLDSVSHNHRQTAAPPSRTDRAPGEVDPEKLFKQQLRFCLHGERHELPPGVPGPVELQPVLFKPYSDLRRRRYDYPLCLQNDPNQPVQPLRQLFDRLIEEWVGEGDEGELRKRYLLELETQIKHVLHTQGAHSLTKARELAIEQLRKKQAGSEARDEKRAALRQDAYSRVATALPGDALVIDCLPQTAPVLAQHLCRIEWQERSKAFAQEVDEVIIRLREVLLADFAKSPAAHAPDYLEAAIGEAYATELDLGEFSHLLEEAPVGVTLEEKRKQRMEQVLATIEAVRAKLWPHNRGESSSPSDQIEPPPFFCRADSPDEIAYQYGRITGFFAELVDFFRALRIARLELENKYRESRHDTFFAGFGLQSLRADEFALIPPPVLFIAPEAVNERTATEVIELLAAGVPIKVIAAIDEIPAINLLEPDGLSPAPRPHKLAEMALAQSNVFVLQASLSQAGWLAEQVKRGFRHAGPAVFSIFTGSTGGGSSLPPYLQAAACLESRLFPAMVFDPAAGENWAAWFDLSGNPQVEWDWPVETVDDAAFLDEHEALPVALTPADVLATDHRYAKHFLVLPQEAWHEGMQPVDEAIDQMGETLQAIPYIPMVDGEGTPWRVVVSWALLQTVASVRRNWRRLQELAGINNSHVLAALAEEKQQFEIAKQQEVAEIEARYQKALDQQIGTLAQDIVSRIATGLLNQTQAGPTAVAPPVPAPQPIPQQAAPEENAGAAEAEAPEEETEEEIVTLDEPYIETARCTSCNECINRNPQMFAYNEEKQAYIRDARAGTYRELVEAAELCPVHIIHPGKPLNPDEPNLDELLKRAAPYL